MILLDDRGHEPPLLPYFHPYGVEIDSMILDSADIMFAGNGPNGTVSIGLERKKVSDAVSSIRNDKLGGFQLDGLIEFDFPFIILEGRFRPQRTTGLLEVWSWKEKSFITHKIGRSPMMFSELIGFMWTMQLICNIRIMRTNDPEETASQCVSLYNWFQKDWSKHKAHKGIYAPVPENNGRVGMVRRKPSLCVKIAAQLPHVDTKAWQVADYFNHDVWRMTTATPDEWKSALGIKGKTSKIAEDIIGALLNGRHN